MRHAASVFLGLLLASPALAAGRPMTVDDLLAVQGVSDPQPSPDGKLVVYVVGALDKKSGKTNTDLWLVPFAGGEPRRLTTAPGADNSPRWSPDGKQISFLSDRSGSAQVWLLPLEEGGEARQLTKLPVDVGGPIYSPKGDLVAFTAEIYPGKTPEETAAKDKEKEESKSKARTFDHLMIRHWTSWDEGKRSHLFVADSKTGEARDLTPRLDVNTPPGPFGGASDYAFSPDGAELAFTVEPQKDMAWSTNSDIWTVPTAGGALKNLTEDNPAADGQPAYSPDGKWLAYVSQARAGFEADMWVLNLRNRATGKVSAITKGLDRPIQSFAWEGGKDQPSTSIIAVIDHEGTEPVARLRVGGSETPKLADILIVKGGANTAAQPVPGRNAVVFLRGSANHPSELYKAEFEAQSTQASASKPQALSHHNDKLIGDLDLNAAERFTFKGADGDTVGGFVVRPPGFDEHKKYPVAFLIHGGPQGAWHDEWHNRWNYAMFAAPGYAVVAINPRGSTGNGQKFTDQISQDWTGRVYDDLMKGLDHAMATYPFLDGKHMAAAGGSYGGFMVNWIAGHSDRFQALVSHAGVFDQPSMYFTTEELWFPEWEFAGVPWKNPTLYNAQSPSHFVQNFKTPTLVLHGALDFRVPEAQGLGMFTALQRQGVTSRYVFFPDEGHWILKPANRTVWWNEVHGWLKKYLQ